MGAPAASCVMRLVIARAFLGSTAGDPFLRPDRQPPGHRARAGQGRCRAASRWPLAILDQRCARWPGGCRSGRPNRYKVNGCYAFAVIERLAASGQTIVLQMDQSHINDMNEVLMLSVRLRKRALPAQP